MFRDVEEVDGKYSFKMQLRFSIAKGGFYLVDSEGREYSKYSHIGKGNEALDSIFNDRFPVTIISSHTKVTITLSEEEE